MSMMCESDHAGWVVVICFTLRHKKTQTSNVSLKKWSGGRLLNTLFHLIRAAVMKYTNTAKVISRVQRFIHSSDRTNIWATFTFKIMSSYFQWSEYQTASYCWKHQKIWQHKSDVQTLVWTDDKTQRSVRICDTLTSFMPVRYSAEVWLQEVVWMEFCWAIVGSFFFLWTFLNLFVGTEPKETETDSC